VRKLRMPAKRELPAKHAKGREKGRRVGGRWAQKPDGVEVHRLAAGGRLQDKPGRDRMMDDRIW
jgi:hypothetical protein